MQEAGDDKEQPPAALQPRRSAVPEERSVLAAGKPVSP